MTFSQPSAGGDQFDAKDHNGRLILVYPKSFAAETPTAHGISPSADVDILVVDAVDATGRPLYFQNARLFGNLAKSVSRDLGGKVLGRLGQVPTQRGNPAWVLQPFTDQDAALATPADAAYQAGQFKQAENPMAATQQPASNPAPAWNAAGTPAAPPAAAPAAQWQPPTPAPQAAPAYAPQATPTAPPQQQWSPPAQQAGPPAPTAAPPAAAPAPAAAIDPNLLAFLAERGFPGPFPDQATAAAIANSLG